MIVPTGRARWATSTFGPIGIFAAASAWGVDAPAKRLLAAKAVPIATISAPTSNISFLLSMLLVPPS